MDIYDIRGQLSGGRTIYDLPLRVTYYARVSTDKDEQLHSLSAQVRYYTEYIRRNPRWVFVEGYIDEGISGTSVGKRENFLRMIDDAAAGRFDFIVTKEISRFSRNTLDSIRYTQELLRCGVGVLFESDNINTLMPDAELRLTIMSSIAQDEVRKISERVRFGFKRAIENGVVLGNDRIWGYEKRDGRLVIKEDEAEIVRTIFDLYANERMGIRTIAGCLSSQGRKNTKGNDFSFSTIRGILCNPKYKGWYCGRKSSKIDYKLNTIKHFPEEEWVMYRDAERVPPIVPEELWDKANLILSRRSARQSAGDKTGYQNRYPYSGKIICGVHKLPYYRALYRYKSGARELWQCQEYSRKGRSGCTAPALYTAELDEVMRQALEELPIDKTDILRRLMEIYRSIGSGGGTEEAIARCRADMESISKRKDKLLDLSVEGHISDEEFTRRNERFNGEIDRLRLRLEELEEEKRKDPARPAEALRRAAAEELTFAGGFSAGVIDALLDRVEVRRQEEKNQVLISVYLRDDPEEKRFLIRRERGRASVCSRQYT